MNLLKINDGFSLVSTMLSLFILSVAIVAMSGMTGKTLQYTKALGTYNEFDILAGNVILVSSEQEMCEGAFLNSDDSPTQIDSSSPLGAYSAAKVEKIVSIGGAAVAHMGMELGQYALSEIKLARLSEPRVVDEDTIQFLAKLRLRATPDQNRTSERTLLLKDERKKEFFLYINAAKTPITGSRHAIRSCSGASNIDLGSIERNICEDLGFEWDAENSKCEVDQSKFGGSVVHNQMIQIHSSNGTGSGPFTLHMSECSDLGSAMASLEGGEMDWMNQNLPSCQSSLLVNDSPHRSLASWDGGKIERCSNFEDDRAQFPQGTSQSCFQFTVPEGTQKITVEAWGGGGGGAANNGSGGGGGAYAKDTFSVEAGEQFRFWIGHHGVGGGVNTRRCARWTCRMGQGVSQDSRYGFNGSPTKVEKGLDDQFESVLIAGGGLGGGNLFRKAGVSLCKKINQRAKYPGAGGSAFIRSSSGITEKGKPGHTGLADRSGGDAANGGRGGELGQAGYTSRCTASNGNASSPQTIRNTAGRGSVPGGGGAGGAGNWNGGNGMGGAVRIYF